MSRPRKVDYNEVISAWLRCGDATVVAATLGLGKSTVYKILNRYEYGLLGVDGGEPLALREQPKADQERLDEFATFTAKEITDCFPRFKRDGDILSPLPASPPDTLTWGEHSRAMADAIHALSMNGKTAANSDKGAVDFQYKGKPYHVIARFPVWPVVLAVAVVALGAWLWRAL